MKVTLLVFTDGRRDCLRRTLQAFEANMNGMLDPLIMVDDSGDAVYGQWLNASFPDYSIVHNPRRLGFAGAVQKGLGLLPRDTDYVFWLEDDFVIQRPIHLDQLVGILGEHPYLAQIVLKRQPVNSEELRAGGIVELNPSDFADQTAKGWRWTEHGRNFSTNPNLTPYRITRLGWPPAPDSERKFSDMLKANGYRFAFLGGKFDPPIVEHIGAQRVGTGY